MDGKSKNSISFFGLPKVISNELTVYIKEEYILQKNTHRISMPKIKIPDILIYETEKLNVLIILIVRMT